MKKNAWTKTKKEFELNEEGKYVEKRKIFIRKSKNILGFQHIELIDITIKVLGLIAIIVPIFLFYLNDRNEKKIQRALIEIELYSVTSTDLHRLINAELTTQNYSDILLSVLYEKHPKILLIGNDYSAKILKELEINLHYKPVTDSLVNILGSFRKAPGYNKITRQLRGTRIVDPLELKIDSNGISNLFSTQLNQLKMVSEYGVEIELLAIEDSNSEISDSTKNYLFRFSKYLHELDSLQNLFLWEVDSFKRDIELSNKYLENNNSMSENKRLLVTAESILQLDYNQSKVLRRLEELKAEHKNYMRKLLDSFNNEFKNSNEILLRDNYNQSN